MIKKILVAIIIALFIVFLFTPKIKQVSISNETLMLELINAERVQKRLPPLKLNKILNQASLSHALEMAGTNTLSHEVGGSLTNRLKYFKYNWMTCAENIAFNQLDVNEAMVDWMNSSGHRRNILNSDVTELGVGIALSKNKKPYYCTIFGKPAK